MGIENKDVTRVSKLIQYLGQVRLSRRQLEIGSVSALGLLLTSACNASTISRIASATQTVVTEAEAIAVAQGSIIDAKTNPPTLEDPQKMFDAIRGGVLIVRYYQLGDFPTTEIQLEEGSNPEYIRLSPSGVDRFTDLPRWVTEQSSHTLGVATMIFKLRPPLQPTTEDTYDRYFVGLGYGHLSISKSVSIIDDRTGQIKPEFAKYLDRDFSPYDPDARSFIMNLIGMQRDSLRSYTRDPNAMGIAQHI